MDKRELASQIAKDLTIQYIAYGKRPPKEYLVFYQEAFDKVLKNLEDTTKE